MGSMNHVLLVEPNKVLSKIYVSALEEAGFKVMHCSSAQSAIAAADEQLPDVVVLELNMAGHNGVEFLYELRSYPDWQKIPVIVNTMTGKDAINIGNSVWENLGIQAYHYKPQTTLKDLIKSIQIVLVANGAPA